ncbi:MAG TPA: baseplate J/gp47 family protein [Rhizomicrobium sp.]|nr:baseplate J/gp47 family protein [Rhizomicrobium sp.]
MSLPRPPELEPRRFDEFEAEILARARSWIPGWSLNDSESDFGRALLAVAARFGAEVAERLDRVGDKMARGFLDWLAIRGDAARPARLPVAFKLADTMKESVQAPRRTRMQVEALGTSVSFETETDVLIVPGGIQSLVAVDPDKDAIYLPPPGLSSLAPIEPAPVQWRLKSFAAKGSTTLQLDPGAGLAAGMLIEIAGAQYTVVSAKDDLVTIEPAVPDGGFAETTVTVAKVSAFRPFLDGGGARNMQDHVLYIGDDDLLNIQSAAVIDILGAQTLPDDIAWEYWGKANQSDDPAWLSLPLYPGQQKDDALVLSKPKGSMEQTKIGASQSRWIRARTSHIEGNVPLLGTDGLKLRVNAPLAHRPTPPPEPDPKDQPALSVFVNSTSSAATQFYPLGREPRLFDTLYLGCTEAFSKPSAAATVTFSLSASLFKQLSGLDVGSIGKVLAAVDNSGALNLFVLDADGIPTRLSDRGPLVPQAADGKLMSLSTLPPAMVSEGTNLLVAMASGNQVWAWQETRPMSAASAWAFKGSLPDLPGKTIEALAPVGTGTATKLFALRDGKLFVSPPAGAGIWAAQALSPTVVSVKAIAPVVPELPFMPQDVFLAIVDTGGGTDLCVVDGSGTRTTLLTNVASDVRPFGIKRYFGGIVEAVAAADDHSRLLARHGGTISQAQLVTGTKLDKAGIGGRIESGRCVAYCLAATAANKPILLSWSPFDPAFKSIAFEEPVDLAVGTPSAPVAVLSRWAFTPGANESEIMAATLDGARKSFPTQAASFVSAVAFAKPAPALPMGDKIAVEPNLDVATIGTAMKDGLGDSGGLAFQWLDRWLDLSTASQPIRHFDMTPGATVTTGQIGANAHKIKNMVGPVPAANDFLLVEGPPNVFKAVKVNFVSSGGNVVTLFQPLSGVTNDPVSFRVASALPGQVFPALALNASNNGFDIALLDEDELYFPDLQFTDIDPARQQAVAVLDDGQPTPHALRIALGRAWDTDPSAAQAFALDATVTRWSLVRSDITTNPAISWEYWNGTGWWRLDPDPAVDNLKDATSNLRNSGDVSFIVPRDLKPVDWSGKTDYWIRGRLVGGDYGSEKVVATTKYNSDGTTEQTIARSQEGIRPPFAVSVGVAYRAETAVVPDLLLTSDSLTLRDQSDANRTDGAMIEAFVPLAAMLARLEKGPAHPAGESCAPDCDCASSSLSSVPAPPSPPAPPTGTKPGRAIYIGVNAELEGAPINVFFEIETEGAFDALAPLAAHALDGDHLVRLAAQDATRAMSETGLVSVVASTPPAMAQLFGATLSWLRLAPRAGSTDWTPKLAGAYLNAVWTHAAETMTRERLGSSVGAPDMVVTLARPPLLHDTLELRVREPLGDDERKALTADDPDTVKSDVDDMPGDWVLWRQVDDPHDWDATDRVYSLDEDSGVIRFGNGLSGMIPPAGADGIVAFEYERTEPVTPDGVPGNAVAARATLNLATPLLNVESVTAIERSAGGVPPEPSERVLKFGAAKLRHRDRAVTAKDFEDLALEESADVVQARCFAANGKIRLVVAMRGDDPMPDRAQIRALTAMLAERAPSQAAQALTIVGPVVRRLRIYLTLRVATLDVAGEIEGDVKAALEHYFDTETGGSDGEGWPLGASPSETDIAEALLKVDALEGFAAVARMEVGDDGAETPWPDAIRANELAMAAKDGVRIDFEIADAAA